jgi:hypothetical protein
MRTAIWQCEADVSRRGGSCSFNVVLVQLPSGAKRTIGFKRGEGKIVRREGNEDQQAVSPIPKAEMYYEVNDSVERTPPTSAPVRSMLWVGWWVGKSLNAGTSTWAQSKSRLAFASVNTCRHIGTNPVPARSRC